MERYRRSSYIFILCAEILCIEIRANPKIKGIKIHDIEYKLSQFADDTSITLHGSNESLNETLSTLSKFSEVLGLRFSFNKTQVILIGKKKYSSETIKTKWKLLWNQHQFQLLGINFHVDVSKMIRLNYEKNTDIQQTLKK